MGSISDVTYLVTNMQGGEWPSGEVYDKAKDGRERAAPEESGVCLDIFQ